MKHAGSGVCYGGAAAHGRSVWVARAEGAAWTIQRAPTLHLSLSLSLPDESVGH